MVVDLETLVGEIKNLKKSGFQITNKNLKISPLAHLILPYHKSLDIEREALKGNSAIGTTGRGLGPAYEDKIARQGIRIIDIAHKKTLKAKLQLVLKEKNKILNKVFNKPTFKIEEIISTLL